MDARASIPVRRCVSSSGWLERCDVQDERRRRPTSLPHQWRHTLGTKMINRDARNRLSAGPGSRLIANDVPDVTGPFEKY